MAKRFSDLWIRLTKLKIDPQDMIDLFAELAARHQTGAEIDDVLTEMALILLPRHAGEPERMHCIAERAVCFRAMMNDERWRGWTIQSHEPGLTWINSSLLVATAKCPLHWKNERFHFNPDEFFAIALLERDHDAGGAN